MRGENEGEALYRRPDLVAWGGDRPPLPPTGGATGPPGACRLGPLVGRPRGGRQAPSFFFSRDFIANLKKKNYI